MDKILIIGGLGQIGSDLIVELNKTYKRENIIATDVCSNPSEKILNASLFEQLNITDFKGISNIVDKYKIDIIINLAAILSANGEKNPMLAWDINMNGLINVLEIAREKNLKQVLTPSSIAAFGPETPKENTPQETILRPSTMYGITKVAGELLGNYYFKKYNLDVRGLRYPGIISYETLPGGGTTDYAVAIYYDAIKYKKYTCFVNEETKLPMMYMPDCLKATVDLMHADVNKLRYHADYNVGSMSFSVKELANSIKKYIPEFEIEYKPDYRQAIADSWPDSIDDSAARRDWNWNPSYDLDSMTKDMLEKISAKQ